MGPSQACQTGCSDEPTKCQARPQKGRKSRLHLHLKRLFQKLQIGLWQKKNERIGLDGAALKTLPLHISFFTLPAELRNIIYEFIWINNGIDYIREQLRGFASGTPNNFSGNFRPLLTCRQFYQEAFIFAYRQTCFYYFRSYAYTTLACHFSRLQPSQIDNIRSIAFWSNPYLCEEFVDHIPITLTSITICSNYMSGSIPEAALKERVRWIVELVKKVKTLKRFQFRTGCSLTPESLKSDCEYAVNVRNVFHQRSLVDEGFSLGPFNAKTQTATLGIHESNGERPRSVELMVASVYEIDT